MARSAHVEGPAALAMLAAVEETSGCEDTLKEWTESLVDLSS